MLTITLLTLALLGSVHSSPQDPSYKAGIVCRITKPALLVLNQETVKVIQTAFQRTSYPDIKGEKAVLLLGRVQYRLHNIQINHLSIASSQVELVEAKTIDVSIQNVSVVFRGTLNYGYTGAWGFGVNQSVDFEIDSAIDLQINTQLICDEGTVRTQAPDCYLNFHKLLLRLQGEREPGWLKQLFTNFISFTLTLVLKGQVCKEINTISNIMADFVQTRAASILTDGDIGVDISVTRSPVITDTYVETHHKEVLEAQGFNTNQEIFQQITAPCLDQARVTVHCLNVPKISCQEKGVVVTTSIVVKFLFPCPDGQEAVAYTFEEDIITIVQASYSQKKLSLHLLDFQCVPQRGSTISLALSSPHSLQSTLRSMITTVGIPEVMSRLEVVFTALMNSKGLDLFEIINPEIITLEGCLVLQMDFGFPAHLLVDFLQRLS
ncbi:cholesteryl ester transfer protein isoform X2 [Ochotona curzoniae]|uniref:cholesteryl ester transfer protein isoform X2 n=1 Tax=Ochotona curzoniae TaxID=130825 RepID=UPI001B35014F|nr:cholesteryl ester transfer protein isoform X2 [Ochotona curzoniae]